MQAKWIDLPTFSSRKIELGKIKAFLIVLEITGKDGSQDT